MKKAPLILLAFVVVVLTLWFSRNALGAYWQKIAGPSKTAIPEEYLATAERRNIDYSIEVSGDVAPEFQLEVKSEVGGKVKALHVEPGQQVKAGQLLAEIDDTDLQNSKASAVAEVTGCQLSVDRAMHNFNRGKELFKAKLITKESFDNLESDLAIAKNELSKSQRKLQSAEDQITKSRLVAAIDGTVLQVQVIEGQVVVAAGSVNSGTTLLTIADLSKLLVTTNVNQVDVARLSLKQVVTVRMESIKQETMDARISFIAPVATIKNSVKGFQVQAAILKPSARLRPGMMVNLAVPVAHADQAIAIPVSAVFKGRNDKQVVYLIENGVPREQEVTVGVAALDYAEVKEGLKPGDQILTVEPRVLEKKG